MKEYFTTFLFCLLATLILACNKENKETETAISSVSIEQVTVEMIVGETVQLNAIVLPSNAVDKTVVWTSSNQSVATITTSGVVTAISEGTSTITAKVGGKTGTCVVTVSNRVVVTTSIELDIVSLELIEGQTATLNATVSPSDATNKTVTWTSSDASIATVEDGKVTALSKGTATITASSNDGSGKHASCSVNVKRLVSSITLEKTSMTIYNGQTVAIIATVNPEDANNTELTWNSSDPSIAVVSSSSGILTGISRGNTTITATANDGSGTSATCEVEVKQYVTRIALDRASLAFVVGDSATLFVSALYPDNANDKSFSWLSTDESVATVDDTGKVVAISGGVAIVKAIANDGSGVYASCIVGVAVDLGLSVLWAPCNLCDNGFAMPGEYGDYYAWGEVLSKSIFDWSTYKWCDGNEYTLTKYNNNTSYGQVDDKTTLDPEDDAASAILGGTWRMPTHADFVELQKNCSVVWVKENGIRGRRFTSNIDGYTDKSIFIPAAGFVGIGGSSDVYNDGTLGRYWSSTIYTGYPHTAYTLNFDSSNVGWVYGNYYAGFSIRPVIETQ